MSTLSKHGARLVAVKKEVCNMTENEESPKARPVTSSEAAEEDQIYYLTEKVPFFDVVLSKSHVYVPWQLKLPAFAYPMLPRTVVPVVLRHGGKNWTMRYIGDAARPRFDAKWKDFAIDNKLKPGDACVFEVIDPSCENLVIKVHILRGDLPPKLEALVDTRGPKSSDVIDTAAENTKPELSPIKAVEVNSVVLLSDETSRRKAIGVGTRAKASHPVLA
ncbi:B3 domain-containing protein os04g0386900 [Phtheirospermum japonicum]|uniref:B3 domain-containing protein os04g0386900 n=1 Tax=Phtheirospermum japonicum TaxID=374723 RepID=A0A830CFE2_9LAMI|nr:B3 domain-containing protein os04g0386900 [Phtheirospermum japonicum]